MRATDHHIDLRTAVTALGLPYVAGILSNTTVWAPGTGPLPPKPYTPGRGSADQAAAPRCRASAGQSQGPCVQPASQSMADDHLARGHECAAQIALCAAAHPHRPPRLRAQRTVAGRMAADRMAQRGEGADKVLAVDLARRPSALPVWLISPNCAGASSATIRSSSRSSGSGTSRDAAGAASITTPRSASPPTDS